MENKFQDLIDKEKYQVFLFVCPVTMPFSFASHPWFVINKQGSISRFEVLSRQVQHLEKWGHLYKDFFLPFQGVEMFSFLKNSFWKERLCGKIEGEIAKRMIEFIENSPTAYPYCYSYNKTGTNSNTYAQWVLNSFPEFKAVLPWNSFGKNK